MIFFLCIIASAILYRIGGSDLHIPLKTKWRDWGCPACSILAMWDLHVGAPLWAHAVYFFLGWGSLSTYWDHWGSDDVEWYEWLLTAFVMAMAPIVYAFALGHWIAFAVQAVAQIMMFVCVRILSKNVYIEECGSGASMIISRLAFIIRA